MVSWEIHTTYTVSSERASRTLADVLHEIVTHMTFSRSRHCQGRPGRFLVREMIQGVDSYTSVNYVPAISMLEVEVQSKRRNVLK